MNLRASFGKKVKKNALFLVADLNSFDYILICEILYNQF